MYDAIMAYQIKLRLNVTAWAILRTKARYFDSKFKYETPEQELQLTFSCPTYIATSKQLILDILILAATDGFTAHVLLEKFSDLQSIVLILDYFQIDILWNELYTIFLTYDSFKHRNSFFEMLIVSLPKNHIVIINALKVISQLLNLQLENVVRKMEYSSPSQMSRYLRSCRRANIYTKSLYSVQCSLCDSCDGMQSTKNNTKLIGGVRFHCCGSPVCIKCKDNMKYIPETCPLCGTYITTNSDYNRIMDDIFMARKRRQLRIQYGIQLDIELNVHIVSAYCNAPRHFNS